jgi:hypothetical protein
MRLPRLELLARILGEAVQEHDDRLRVPVRAHDPVLPFPGA